MGIAEAELKVSRQQQADESRYQERQTEDDFLNDEEANAIEEYLYELRFLPDQLIFRGRVRPYSPMEEAINFFEEDGNVMRRDVIELLVSLYRTNEQAKSILYPYFAWKISQWKRW